MFLKELNIAKGMEALIKVNVSTPTREPQQPPQCCEPKKPPPEKPTPISNPTELDCGSGNTQRIEPFAEGRDMLEAAAAEKLKGLVEALKQKNATNRLVGFVLIGSADKRRLRPSLARRFGSNDGLAQARVKTVRDALEQAFEPNRLVIPAAACRPIKVWHCDAGQRTRL